MTPFAKCFPAIVIVAVVCNSAYLLADVPELRDSKSEFLNRFSELQVGLDESTPVDIATFASNCFDAASIRHYQIENANHLSPELCAVEMLLSVFTGEQQYWKAWPVFKIPKNQEAWLSKLDTTQDGFLSYEEINCEIVYIRNIALTSTDWGVLDPALIEACSIIVRKSELLERVSRTFYLPLTTSGFSQSYLTWIALSKPQLEAFQNQFEGYALTDSVAANAFFKRYSALHSYLKNTNPLRVIPPGIVSPRNEWKYMQGYMVRSLDQLLIPPLILDWAQMLDNVASKNWEGALDRLNAIEGSLPKGKATPFQMSTNNRRSLKQFNWKPTYIFWSLLTFSAIGIALTWKDSKPGFLIAIGMLYPAAYLKILHSPWAFTFVPESLFETIGTIILLLPAIAIGGVRNRKFIFSMLTSSWILCLLLPQATFAFSSRLTSASYITLYAAVCTMGILLIQVISQYLRNHGPQMRPRDYDPMVYPTLWFVLLFIATAQIQRWMARADSSFLVFQSLADTGLIVIIGFQIVRYLILRWTNQLNPNKLLLLVISITCLGVIIVAVKAFQLSYTQGSIVLLSWTSGLFLLSSYSIDSKSKMIALRRLREK